MYIYRHGGTYKVLKNLLNISCCTLTLLNVRGYLIYYVLFAFSYFNFSMFFVLYSWIVFKDHWNHWLAKVTRWICCLYYTVIYIYICVIEKIQSVSGNKTEKFQCCKHNSRTGISGYCIEAMMSIIVCADKTCLLESSENQLSVSPIINVTRLQDKQCRIFFFLFGCVNQGWKGWRQILNLN